MSNKWVVVYCKSKEELRAQQNLANQGIHSFFPKIMKEKIIRGKKTQVEEALFPSYLFVNISDSDKNYSPIRSTRGIYDFVKFGVNIASIPEEQIKQLERLCHAHNQHDVNRELLYKNGDKVEIINGAFKGLTAVFEVEDGLERSMLLIKVLNQENKVSFKNLDIKKAES
ncbi:transcription/translation regulatory transformer protein RfaH [Psychromonas sp.]|uniref:transcription/translation regulatory transformer protein RfaH n=1 Tax=Psychromonas sp. TaxID=1884585 RepID=UPI003561CAB9